MECDCGKTLELCGVDEIDATTYLARFVCGPCGKSVGIEGEQKELAPFLGQVCWSDEAQHVLDRMPPYIVPFYREDVERYAQKTGTKLVTFDFLGEAKNQGTVAWSADTLRRLDRVPPAIRAMARIELERTALERGMAEVTVGLMEEIKARYFGLGAAQSASKN